ncbi:glycosyltransferase [Leptolyngbya cf. ectocarpi LEGE 11479]|uniref:Glycosyltransferase n=1 Tax=Leptolyngbya cf. ectocarpi LEGE 11479 TaxID=1828722 RepID=A0A928ZYK6_LEPEC|nr:glycosyltransferase [Leptolyngbya ectocarpi]MBE9069808.1 glycosyltransferase [Leptolyngbya cf. ectocarpi LEGE 11479]
MQVSQVYDSLRGIRRISYLEKWRKRNLYYYQDIEKFHEFLLQERSDVLEIGSGSGNLLASVHPRYGLGIDINPTAVESAQLKFDGLNFQTGNIEEYQSNQVFDYVVLANTISYIENIQKAFQNINQACNASTRLVLTFHNPAWEPLLKFATAIGQRMPLPPLNWLSRRDVENLLNLSGFEVVSHTKRLLFPKRIPILSWLFNKFLAPLPGFNRLCLTEYVVARLQPEMLLTRRQIQEKTCSVIIPARNEAGNIESCITRLPRMGRHTEVIFIEGHSSDNTWEEIQRVQAKYGDQWDIKVFQQTGKGKGNAVRLGFEQASGDILMILDSDLTVRPEELPYFFEAVASGKCEMANGCRLIYPVSKESMPSLNRMANRFFAWLLSYLLNTKIKDSLCGTKVISRENYKKIVENRTYFGDFDPFGDFELLFGASKLGLKIIDIPVRYVPRSYGSSNIQHVKEGLILLKMCMYAARKMKFI